MNKNHLNNLFFTLVVLFAVIFGGVREPKQNSTVEVNQVSLPPAPSIQANKSDSTSLTANLEANFTVPVPPPASRGEPEISADSALVKELFAKQPIFDLNPNKQWSAASLTKLTAAAVALEKIQGGAKITASYKAVATEGGAGNLVVGRAYDRDDLLKAMLVYSSNDAAAALAEYYDTGEELGNRAGAFVEEMNQKALALGMYNTRYFDPHGLSPLNQSTVNDLEKLVHHIFNIRPEIFEWTRIQDGNTHPFVKWENFVGGKTGFLTESNGNLLTLFNNRGRLLVIIVLGSEDRAKDTEALYSRYTQ